MDIEPMIKQAIATVAWANNAQPSDVNEDRVRDSLVSFLNAAPDGLAERFVEEYDEEELAHIWALTARREGRGFWEFLGYHELQRLAASQEGESEWWVDDEH